ncbi:MAG: hypothetical protein FWC22_02285 [Treponema sp.]|nr:hypothetical protein [Treponema sp.]
MKKIIIFGLFLFMTVFYVNAQSRPSVYIVNNTGYEVYYIFMTPTTDDSWGQDILPENQTLEDGESFQYQLPFALREASAYDICLEDLDGDTYTKMNVTVSDKARIIFTFDDFDDFEE